MASFRQPIFSGKNLHHNSAQDYVDAVELNAMAHPGYGTRAEFVQRTMFKEGLTGDAKRWYRELSSAEAENWETVRTRFLAKYRVDERNVAERSLKIGFEIYSLKRKAGEPMDDYVKRSLKLSKKITDIAQQPILISRFLAGMLDGEDGRPLKAQLEAILIAKDWMSLDKKAITTTASFEDFVKILDGCTTSHGETTGDTSDSDESDVDDFDMGSRADERWRHIAERQAMALSNLHIASDTTHQPRQARPQPTPVVMDSEAPRTRSTTGPVKRDLDQASGSTPYVAPPQRKYEGYARPGPRPRFTPTCWNCGGPHYKTECTYDGPIDQAAYNQRRDDWVARKAREAAQVQNGIVASMTSSHDGVRVSEIQEPDQINVMLGQPTTMAMANINENLEVFEANAAKRAAEQAAGQAGAQKRTRILLRPASSSRQTHPPAPVVEEVEDEENERSGASTQGAPRNPESLPAPTSSSTLPIPVVEPLNIPHIAMPETAEEVREMLLRIDPKELRRATRLLTKKSRTLQKKRPMVAGLKDTGSEPLDIVKILSGIDVSVNLLALLDLAPRARADLQKGLKLVSPETDRSTGQAVNLVTTSHGVAAFVGLAQTSREAHHTHLVYLRVSIARYTWMAMVDTGSTINLISPSVAKQMNLTLLKADIPNAIKLANSTLMSISDYVYLDLNMEGIICPMIFWVVESSYDILLGMDFIFRTRARLDYGNFKVRLQSREGLRVIMDMFDHPSVVSARPMNPTYADDPSSSEEDEEDDEEDGDYARLAHLSEAFDAVRVLHSLSRLDVVKSEGKV
ncbi:hypothetical protein MCOR02_001227 [Pyricularia oryzae]|nr:hypothetical protein MCOR02_007178 [Pyricularia oryzae]KAH9436370.1 hypothetical protein MCOR02_000040 [Pyricularia oryzae]KAH9437572.1 hypothetical protein MCOR02_001227 [Pyricularia oryzae]KAI6356925.1 hypothetical protein MCOR32_009901 [Pyricularia oryzae]KAI6517560.1 hypothetical protein MCOR05_011501 [Pyricularia oryzae]